MAEASEVQYRVSWITFGFMVAFAIVCDALQILFTVTGVLILMSDFIAFMAGATYWIWFTILGVKYFSGKKAGTKITAMISTVVIEAIPILSALPMTTVGVIGIINASRAEDRMAVKRPSTAPGAPANDNESSSN